ncbi:MAG: hypothetical protein RLZZ540_328 [Bacteroidota bacterium]
MMKEDHENDFQIKVELDKYLIHWKWFVMTVFVAFVIAFVNLRYTIPEYKASNTILLKDANKGGVLAELSAVSNMGFGRGNSNNVDNEIVILKSRTLVESTVKKMNFNINLIVKGKVVDGEIYNDAPIKVVFLNKTPDFYQKRMSFLFAKVSTNTFTIKNELSVGGEANVIVSNKKEFRYGEPIQTKYGDLVISKTLFADKQTIKENSLINIVVNPIADVEDSFKQRLSVASIEKGSSVIEMGFTDQVPDRAADFLNALVQCYNENAISDKNFIADNTSKFIANRLEIITKELGGVEKDVEDFKKTNQLIDIETQSSAYIDGSTDYNKKIIEIEAQQNLVSSVIDFMKKSDNSSLLPANLIEGDASDLISSYNSLVLDRNRILKTATITNPVVVKMDQQIASLKSNIMESLGRTQTALNIQRRSFRGQEGVVNAKIEKIPTQERQFKIIARQQKVKEELYLYLLQKREETAIALLATEPNARVIDMAKPSYNPISPKKSITYLVALLLGILIPFGVIYIKDLLDTKIKSRLDIEGKTNIPFIGDIPTSESHSEIIQSESRTSSAEALRIIRTNLEFMVNTVPSGQAKTIFMTSTFPKEGKTFVSVNLAATFALSGKKVLLIGMDIRNPKLDEYLTLPDRGVTNYLSSKELNLEDLIVKKEGYEALYILPAGIIPPNPAELLMGKKVDSLFETLKKQYDYIIVDTAPVSLVTDTLLIAKYADCFVYVARANVLEKRMLSIPNTLYKEQKLPNMCILLNDTDSTKGYGYGYGYGVHLEEKTWHKKIFNI